MRLGSQRERALGVVWRERALGVVWRERAFGVFGVSAPRVSVLMTTRNGAAWIGASLDSVFAQSFGDYELVVVDDGSTDATPDILAGLRDTRVRVIRNAESQGIAGGRNIGLAACVGEYVAVLDHDDVSLPERLARQVSYLDGAQQVVLVGTAVEILREGVASVPEQVAHVSPEGMRMMLHLGNPLTWSSVMFRRSALQRVVEAGGAVLRDSAVPADDFDLYHRLLAYGEAARLDGVLTQYRWHTSNTTYRMAAQMAERAIGVLCRAYTPWFGAEAEGAARLVVRHLSDRLPVPDAGTLDRLFAIIARVGAEYPGAECAALGGALRWRLLRAAMREGRPGIVRGRWGAMAWTLDGVASLAVGVGRRVWR